MEPGRILSHYKITEQIGGGGMGVVYKAEDTRLKRTVALKFLPPELSRDPETKERFIHEAQAASSLQHNNICTVHEIDETEDGQIYFVMDHYEGNTLKWKIENQGLRIGEATGIALQIAQGLAAAHEKGILHRDIKPANVLLTPDGTVKIVDFGLAKLSGRSLLTRSGTTLGTAAYMSPEATQGDDAGVRGDVWSLGVVYYQMLSGRLPFGSEHEQAVIYNILNTEPPPPVETLPPECGQILRKALKKDPAERYQSVREMLADIQEFAENLRTGNTGRTDVPAGPSTKSRVLRIGGGCALLLIAIAGAYFLFLRGPRDRAPSEGESPALRRLAVLPFTNLRSDPRTDFLGFALADQIIGQLSYVKTLLVRPSSAVRQFQGEATDVASAAKMLNVDFLLTGNYLKEADLVRLSLELVDIHTNAIIWRESIQDQYVNAFKLEDLVSEKVVSGLKVQFSPDEIRNMQADAPRDPRAYELYLRGISTPTSIDGVRRGVNLLRQSIAIDSTYAPAYGELGWRLCQIGSYEPGEEAQTQAAEQAYQKAIALNPGLLTAIADLSSLYTDMGKTEEAFGLAKRAVALNPGSAESHFFLGYIYRYVGLMDDAVREMEQALALDPGNPRFRSIGRTYVYRGEYTKALKGFDLDAGSPYCLLNRTDVYATLGDTANALACAGRVVAMEPKSIIGLLAGLLRAHLLGHDDEAKAILNELHTSHFVDGEQWYYFAHVDAMLNEHALCALSLRHAIEGGFFNYPLMLTDSNLDPLRDDPAIIQLLAAAKAKREAFLKRFGLNSGSN